MLTCWNNDADKRPTFTEIVTRYRDGLLPGAAEINEEGEYVLLGPEDKNTVTDQQDSRSSERKLNVDSVMNITMTHPQQGHTAEGNGITFDILFVNPSGERESLHDQREHVVDLQPDPELEYYMEMKSPPAYDGCVIANHAANVHEYDDVVESGRGSHVTKPAHHVTHLNGNNCSNDVAGYILMLPAEPALTTGRQK